MKTQTHSKFSILLILCLTIAYTAQAQNDWELTPENISRTYDRQRKTVQEDSLRPVFHLLPPAGCMGDPNGGIFYKGYYHIFYGHNPFNSKPGGWFWAHAKSKDLLHWQHFKPGLTPAFEFGLYSIGSGSTIITEDGKPLAFYSMQPGPKRAMNFWVATLKDDLNQWQHNPKVNPILSLQHPGLPDFDSTWRDPFVFTADGRTFMIACADLFDRSDVIVPIFEAKNKELTEWEYKKLLFTFPKHLFRNFEVPELRPLDDKWVFLASCDAPFDRTLYFVGDFDTENLSFTPESQGLLDYSSHYYAQETIQDNDGNLFLTAWIPGWDRQWLPNFREEDLKNDSELWNGCFAIPRQLALNEAGQLIQKPVESLKLLRENHVNIKARELPVTNVITAIDVLEDVRGDHLELKLELELGTASFCGLNVLCNEHGQGGLYILWSGNVLNIDGVKVPIENWQASESLKLHIFIDKQLVEVFINGGRYCVSRKLKRQYIKGDHVALTRLGGHATLKSLDAWTLNPINVTYNKK